MRVLLALIPLAAGCFNCTQVGCAGTLELRFDAAAFDDGAYDLAVFLDDHELDCAFALGGPADTGLADPSECTATIDGDSLVVSMWLPMGGEPPEAVRLTLDHEGAPFADTRARPDWSEPFHPNGKRCGGACVSGVADLAV